MEVMCKLEMNVLLHTAYYLNEEDQKNMETVFSIPKRRLEVVQARKRIQLLREHYSEAPSVLMEHRSLLMQLKILRLPSLVHSSSRWDDDTYLYDHDTVMFWNRLHEFETLFRQVCLTRCLRKRPRMGELIERGILPEYAKRISAVIVNLIWQLEHQDEEGREKTGIQDKYILDLKQLVQFWASNKAEPVIEDKMKVNEQELRGVRAKEKIAKYEALTN